MKFSQLRVGMLTDRGLILKLTPAGTDYFWGEQDSVSFMGLHDAHWGACGCIFSDKSDWEMVFEEGTVEYVEAVSRMIQERADAATDAARDATRMLEFL